MVATCFLAVWSVLSVIKSSHAKRDYWENKSKQKYFIAAGGCFSLAGMQFSYF